MQGYVTLAVGSPHYLQQAVNLVLSLKLNDPSRPVCLLTDDPDGLPHAFRPYVDEVRRVRPRPGYHGCPSKLHVHEHSPFDESMFIDADSILAKPDMDRHWAKMAGTGFRISGERRHRGEWRGLDIAEVCRSLEIDYMAVMNSGLFCFGADRESAAFFATAQALVRSHRDLLGMLQRNRFQLSDKPFLGAAAGLHGVEPVVYLPAEGSVMISTVIATGVAVDPFRGTSAITKHADFALWGRFLAGSRVRHSPSVAHFVKLRPLGLYQQISDRLRARFGVETHRF
jgi:hypothetical protein